MADLPARLGHLHSEGATPGLARLTCEASATRHARCHCPGNCLPTHKDKAPLLPILDYLHW